MLTDIKKAAASGILISIGGCVLLASTKSGMMWAGYVLFYQLMQEPPRCL